MKRLNRRQRLAAACVPVLTAPALLVTTHGTGSGTSMAVGLLMGVSVGLGLVVALRGRSSC